MGVGGEYKHFLLWFSQMEARTHPDYRLYEFFSYFLNSKFVKKIIVAKLYFWKRHWMQLLQYNYAKKSLV